MLIHFTWTQLWYNGTALNVEPLLIRFSHRESLPWESSVHDDSLEERALVNRGAEDTHITLLGTEGRNSVDSVDIINLDTLVVSQELIQKFLNGGGLKVLGRLVDCDHTIPFGAAEPEFVCCIARCLSTLNGCLGGRNVFRAEGAAPGGEPTLCAVEQSITAGAKQHTVDSFEFQTRVVDVHQLNKGISCWMRHDSLLVLCRGFCLLPVQLGCGKRVVSVTHSIQQDVA
mmetsp:Transcript_111361/g.193252  ORF Transcript_111361/g.193252 Transcript_111361/m.193252 type:complete len:229 (-) Transcript_111361:885-1571(-)